MAKVRFLIVDDSEMIRQFVTGLLKSLGANKIEQADNGQAAYAMIYQSQAAGATFHVVVLDWEMPQMSGFDVLKKVREDPGMKDVAFLMISTVADAARIRKIAPYMPNGYLVKPFKPELFAERIQALCQEIEHTIT